MDNESFKGFIYACFEQLIIRYQEAYEDSIKEDNSFYKGVELAYAEVLTSLYSLTEVYQVRDELQKDILKGFSPPL